VFASVISTLDGHSLIILEVPTALKMGGWEIRRERERDIQREIERERKREREKERKRERCKS
jgi:hypothetical protein